MLNRLICAYLDARFGVNSFKLEANAKRVLLNVFALFLGFSGLIAISSSESEFSFFDALPSRILLVIAAVLFICSDRAE
jgi:hypothetical protein